MTTLTLDQDAPGQGGSGPIFGSGSMPLKIVTGKFSFDNSYPTGGEVLTSVFALFNRPGTSTSNLLGIIMEQPIIAGAQTGKFLRVDVTNKKVQLFTNAAPFAEVANGSDQSLITNLRFIAWGKR